MPESLWLIGGVYLLTGLGLLSLLSRPYQYPEKPGANGFVITITAAAINSFAEAANLFIADFALSIGVWYLRVFGIGVASAGWLLLAIGFATGRKPGPRVRAAAYSYIALLGLGLLVDATLLADSVFVGATGRGWAGLTVGVYPTVGFWLHTAVAYGCILIGIVAFLLTAIQERGLRRRQAIVLTSAGVPAIVTNVLIVSGAVNVVYDLTIFGFAGSICLFWVALYRMSVLDLAPVARETAMEEMDDAVLTLDDENRIVDCNTAARELFDLSTQEYFGQSVESCCPSTLVDALHQVDGTDTVETEVSIALEDHNRHFSPSISPLRTAEETDSRIVVLRDITPIKQRETALESREEELDVFRQVFSRVLRHNIRNELTVIHGSADDLTERADSPIADQAALICEASEDLLDLSEKARYIERVIDSEDGLVEDDLRAIAEEAAEAIRERFPDATIEVIGAESCSVRCNPELDAAVENLIENAVEHNTAKPTVRVEIRDRGEGAELLVRDDGPGIEPDELAVLDAESETQLSHGSGIGLWLVKWIVDRSRADLAFEADEDGTDARIRFRSSSTGPAASD